MASPPTHDAHRASGRFDLLPDGCLLVSEGGVILEANTAAAALNGLSAAELVGRALGELFSTEDRAALESALAEALAAPAQERLPRALALQLRRDNADPLAVEVRLKACGCDDEPMQVCCTFHDRSAQRAAEEALRDSRARLAAIIDSAMDAIVTADEDQKVVVFNAAAEELFGCAAAEALGSPLERFIPRPHRDAHRAHMRRFRDSHAQVRKLGPRTLAGLRADGREVPLEASVSQAQEGGRTFYTGIFRDVSRRLAAEAAVAEAQGRFRAVVQHAHLGIAIAEPSGAILEVNSALEAMLGLCASELRGVTYSRLIRPRDRRRAEAAFAGVIEGELQHPELELRLIRRDGDQVWVRVTFTAAIAQSRVRYGVLTVEDIRAAKRREAALRRRRARQADVLARLATLTRRERQVFDLLIQGKPSKIIADELGASPKTIEIHRGRVMHKMQTHAIAELVRMALAVRALPEYRPAKQA